MTPGLQWFIRFYGRLRPARNPITEEMQLHSAARLGGKGRGLLSLEIRTSPEDNKSSLARYIEKVFNVQQSWAQQPRELKPSSQALELGIVYHFTKDREGGARAGHPMANWQNSHADPAGGGRGGENATGYRFARCFSQKQREASALAWVLQRYPLSVQVVRGLDVCTDELGIPNWVFAPLLTHVRKAADSAVGFLRARLGCTLPPLRTTVHAGEDFMHLQNGLRSVDEAIEHFRMREGDRIGHGMALGIDPREWARRTGRLPIAVEDRLFDLIWEWNWYGLGCLEPPDGVMRSLDYELASLTRQLFESDLPPIRIAELRCDLADTTALRRVGFPRGLVSPLPMNPAAGGNRERLRLLHKYLTSRSLFQRGREAIWIDPSSDGERLARLQAGLRRKMGSLGIVVEVNPTSNLLLGDLADLTVHPMWRLRPPRPLPHDAPPVGVCIGSDDPLTFNSALPQEYQCLWDAMKLAGLSDEEARQWLDRTRACSLESRFTLSQVIRFPMRTFVNSYEPALVPPL